MKYNWTKVLLSTAVISTLFAACKPDPDTDTPFPPEVSPSVFVGSKNQFIYALNPATGVKKWETFIGSEINSSPVLYKGTLFVGNSSTILYKLDPIDGKKEQSSVSFPSGMETTPVGVEGFLIGTSGDKVICIDIEPDTVEWIFTAGGGISSSPTVRDTQVVFGCNDGYVYTLDYRNGNTIWKSASYTTFFPSSPTTDENAVYIGAENGKLYGLRRTDGSEIWTPYATGGPIKSSPLVYGGNVIFGSDDSKVYCLDNISGTPRWATTTSDRMRSSPYLNGQTIYIGSYDKTFYAISTLDGAIKWTFPTTGLIASSPVCYRDYVYFGSYDTYLYAIDTSDGKAMWKYKVNGLMDCSPSIDPNASNGNGINSTISGGSIY